MKHKTIPKKVRELIYKKYDGHCAYCGCELKYKDMQVDHINSVYRAVIMHENVDENISNYMPSCRQCNFYKSTFTLENFRERLSDTLIKNLQKKFNYKLALKYGLITENVKPVEFYFERIEKKEVSL